MLSFPPDWTFVFQIVLFLILWTVLRRLLFDPHLVVLRDREQRTTGALQEANRLRAAAEEMAEHYKAQLSRARAQSLQEVDRTYREAEEQARALLEAARADAARTTAEIRERIRYEIEAARQRLTTHIPEFSRTIAEKLVGRPLT
ncbi:MAG: ATP synthase F0 subunit B [Candidatus Binatia bacterium]|nr:ATP synthase F0 subunit B [Candidatus Binatia bacterium]